MSERYEGLWHISRPGPQYWSWKCLVCDQRVSDHPGPIRLLLRKVRASI